MQKRWIRNKVLVFLKLLLHVNPFPPLPIEEPRVHLNGIDSVATDFTLISVVFGYIFVMSSLEVHLNGIENVIVRFRDPDGLDTNIGRFRSFLRYPFPPHHI